MFLRPKKKELTIEDIIQELDGDDRKTVISESLTEVAGLDIIYSPEYETKTFHDKYDNVDDDYRDEISYDLIDKRMKRIYDDINLCNTNRKLVGQMVCRSKKKYHCIYHDFNDVRCRYFTNNESQLCSIHNKSKIVKVQCIFLTADPIVTGPSLSYIKEDSDRCNNKTHSKHGMCSEHKSAGKYIKYYNFIGKHKYNKIIIERQPVDILKQLCLLDLQKIDFMFDRMLEWKAEAIRFQNEKGYNLKILYDNLPESTKEIITDDQILSDDEYSKVDIKEDQNTDEE